MGVRVSCGDERFDRVGIAASTACAVHCVAFPVLAAVLPIFGARGLGHPGVEWTLLATSIIVGTSSIVRCAVRIHRRRLPVVLFAAGAALLLIKRTLAEGTRAELPLAILGASLIVLAHGGNIVACRRCPTCNDETMR